MKILSLDLHAFGPFTGELLDLSGGEEGLHLILGPNEAGKSSALRALQQMLFGIPKSTKDNFTHENQKLRVGGTLRNGDGEELAFLRRKGNKNTLMTADGTGEIDEAAFLKVLGGLTSDRYGSLFSLDHDSLVSGGKEVATGKGSVGELIFGAGTDLRRFRELQKNLAGKYGEIFKPRALNPSLNKSFQDLSDARDKIENASLKSADWVAENGRREEAARLKADLEEKIRDRTAEHSRLGRTHLALEDISGWKACRARLEELADAARLRDGFSRRHTRAKEEHQDARTKLNLARERIESLAAEEEKLGPPSPLLAHRDSIADCSQRLASLRSRDPEMRDVESKMKDLEEKVLHALRDLDRPMRLDEAEELRLTAAQRERVRNLKDNEQALVSDCQTLHKSVADLQLKAAELRQSLDALPAPPDTSSLGSALKRARDLGDIEDRIKAATDFLLGQEREARSSLARLRPWKGRFEDLGTVAVPSRAAIETHQSALETAAQRERKALDLLAEAEETHAKTLAQRATLEGGRPIPTLQDLQSARARRDAVWTRIESALRSPDETVGPDLSLELRQATDTADDVADRRFAEADRVARLERLHSDSRAEEAAITARRLRRDQAVEERNEAQTEWTRLWAGLGFIPLSPKEMLAWHQDYERLAEKVEALRKERAWIEKDERKLDRIRSALISALGSVGVTSITPIQSLPDLMDLGGDFLDKQSRRATKREGLMDALARTEKEIQSLRAQETEAAQSHESWKNDWSQALAPLGLEGGSSGREALKVLELAESTLRDYEHLSDLRKQLDSHRSGWDRLEDDSSGLVSRLAPDLSGSPLEHRLAELNQRLAGAADAQSKREEKASTRKAEEKRAEEAREAMLLAEARLKELAREVGAPSIDEIGQAEERALQRASAEDQLAEIEDRLRKLSAGQPLETFVAEAEREVPRADTLKDELDSMHEEIESLAEQRETALRTETEARVRLQQMDETAKQAAAYAAATEAQHVLARIGSQTDQYVRARLASALLRQAVERYRSHSQAPVLRRSSNLFAALTCGSFSGLDTDLDDHDQPFIVGVRDSGERLTVDKMSEGTCDQLYLALKLASLEHDLDHGPAFPFVADDILVNFDDQRAEAALKVLGGLSQRTQVLFFTHHEHLVRLAQSVLPPDVLFVQELRRPRPAS